MASLAGQLRLPIVIRSPACCFKVVRSAVSWSSRAVSSAMVCGSWRTFFSCQILLVGMIAFEDGQPLDFSVGFGPKVSTAGLPEAIAFTSA